MNIKAVEEIVETTRGDLQHLAGWAVNALKSVEEVAQVCTDIQAGGSINLELALDCFDRPLVHALLRRTLMSDLELELVFTSLRSEYLKTATVDTEHYGLMTSLALQCFHNDFAWFEKETDGASLDTLEADPQIGIDRIVTYSMFRPLSVLQEPLLESIFEAGDPDLNFLLTRQVLEPYREKELQEQLPTLGLVEDETSKRVADQYQESPYPRWLSIPQQKATELRKQLEVWCPSYRHEACQEILIPGCGSGQHCLQLASAFPASRVTALDLSRSSLAYGWRRSQELGIPNLDFWHGDLLQLANHIPWNRRFGFIDAVGVLHHLREPLLGCQALYQVLEPGGLIRIGLYSGRARQAMGLTEARDRYPLKERSPTAFRQVRRDLIKEDFSSFLDFHTLNGFRDLLYPAQEHCFSVPEACELVKEAGFNPIRLQVTAGIKRDFERSRASEDVWEDWDLYEQANPKVFKDMIILFASR